MTYKVIQWATGNVGRAAIKGILAHPELELVGTWVHGEAKDGVDVGEICGIGPVGVAATRDADKLLASDADCILYSPLMGQTPEVIRFLESGFNVVTPLGWFYPFGTAGVAEVEAACRKGGVTLHGTGIHPGGITERLPLTAASFCREVSHVRAEEFSDIRSYAAEFVVKEIMLFGKSPEEAASSSMPAMLGAGFMQSLDMIAAAMGVTLDPEKRTTHETAIATAPIDTPIGVIDKGTVAGQRFSWEGTVDGEAFVTARTNWLMGDEHLDPPWKLGEERFEVEITGEPGCLLTFHGLHPETPEAGIIENPGIVATANHCVSAIPATCRAESGIRTYLDMPLYTGSAAPRLRR